MTGGCLTACGITSPEGEAGCPPVAVEWLPGRRAGLEVVENLLTSIDARAVLARVMLDGRLLRAGCSLKGHSGTGWG